MKIKGGSKNGRTLEILGPGGKMTKRDGGEEHRGPGEKGGVQNRKNCYSKGELKKTSGTQKLLVYDKRQEKVRGGSDKSTEKIKS